MKFECKEDPNKLIEKIGDAEFWVADIPVYKHVRHPKTVRIIDCEDGTHIDVTAEYEEDSLECANALCDLLNQNYERI